MTLKCIEMTSKMTQNDLKNDSLYNFLVFTFLFEFCPEFRVFARRCLILFNNPCSAPAEV